MLVLWVVGVVERVRVHDNCEVLVASCCCSYSFLASCCSYSCSYSCSYLEVVFGILVVVHVVLHKDDEQVVHEDVDAAAAGKKELVGPLPLLDVSFFP